ncbi:MAG TPA: hypothetical protein VFM18_06045 [Methanosarcina sp.]|nr:hypothetical protein [Methanosarcina sp.]
MTETIAKAPRGRVKRTPIGTRNRLTVHNKDSKYEYRIVNDVDDRVAAFQQNGWEVVQAKEVSIGDKRLESVSATGSAAEISVGNGTKAIVMRIPKEWFDEDQRAKAAHTDALEQTMKEDAKRGYYGTLSNTRD